MPDGSKVETTDTVIKEGICYMCTTGCPTKIHVRGGRATHIEMSRESVASTCPRWRAQLDFVYHPERLLYPLKRSGKRGKGSFTRISWDEALDTAASRLNEIKNRYGAEAAVFYISYPKEPRPYFHRLAHAFGSPNYCTESSNCFSSAWLATTLTYGRDYGGFINRYSRGIDPATRCKVIWGSSIRNSAPENWHAHLEARRKGLKLIVVDPRRTKIANTADIHLQLRPGTDGALALGMIHVILSENLQDREFIKKWTVGFEEIKNLAHEYTPERVELITKVAAAKVKEAAIMYATEKPAQIGLSISATTHCSNGLQNHRAIILLPALTSNLDIAGGNRGMPAPPPVNDITLHERVGSMPPGLGAERFPIWTQMYHEMQSNMLAEQIESGKPYPIKALFGAGINLSYFPNSKRLIENLKRLDFILVTEYVPTQATRFADIILPISSWPERTMLMVSREGHIRLVEPAIEPVGETKPEWKIIFQLADRLGLSDDFWNGDFEDCLNHILKPTGITTDELRQHPEGIQVPTPPRQERQYERTGFQTPSGKVEIASSILANYGHQPLPVYREPAESPLSRPELAQSFPLVLTTGARIIAFTHSQYRNIQRLRRMVPEPRIEINPADAAPRGIESDTNVKVSSMRGSIRLRAQVTDIVPPGVVHAMHHWQGDANVNILADDRALDPISGFASFKAQLCQVSKE